jgi:hypothetical protein
MLMDNIPLKPSLVTLMFVVSCLSLTTGSSWYVKFDPGGMVLEYHQETKIEWTLTLLCFPMYDV